MADNHDATEQGCKACNEAAQEARDACRADYIAGRLNRGSVVSLEDYEFLVMHDGERCLTEDIHKAVGRKKNLRTAVLICCALIMRLVCRSKVAAYGRHAELTARVAALEAKSDGEISAGLGASPEKPRVRVSSGSRPLQ